MQSKPESTRRDPPLIERIKDRLSRDFFDRPTSTVARQLLGKTLLRYTRGRWVGGFIVETEAYLPEGDSASHSARGKTPSNAAMFDQPGTLYVYPIHAKFCMNAVTERLGRGSAVLIRAIEPSEGIDIMRANRGYDEIRRLTRGPAMLCQALAVDRGLDGTDLIDGSEIVIAEGRSHDPFAVTTTKRIGISSAADLKLRFFIDGNRFVSGRASDHRHRRVIVDQRTAKVSQPSLAVIDCGRNVRPGALQDGSPRELSVGAQAAWWGIRRRISLRSFVADRLG